MHTAARIILGFAGSLIAVGGVFDLLTPTLPANLAAACDGNALAERIIRELLRALGGALTGIGAALLLLVVTSPALSRFELMLILVLAVPAETLNAVGMFRARSAWQFPAAFGLITVAGVLMALR